VFDMSTGYLIAMLALSNMQYAVIARQPALLNNVYVSNEVSVELLAASNGNPWALPMPDEKHLQDSSGRQLPVKRRQQSYITQEELESLERLPEEQRFYGKEGMPLNRKGLPYDGAYSNPGYRGGYGVPGYYGWDSYPGSIYGGPLYPGMSPLIEPYGYTPYRGIPYEQILPFTY
jgi:hypothetical protein